jgi:hypothetical protein
MGIRTARFFEVPNGPEVELNYNPEGDHVLTEIAGDKVIVGYLAHDSDAENPLESCEGLGKIYSSHRHAGQEQHRAMQEALGLDTDWEPDYEPIWIKHQDEAIRRYIEAVLAKNQEPLLLEEFLETFEREPGQTDNDFIRSCLEADAKGCNNWGEVPFGAEIKSVLSQMYLEPEYTTRDLDAVVLDCFQHSCTIWSVTGEGYQCRWDTARGAGVWVPDNCAREEIERRTPVYAHYWIEVPGVLLRGENCKYLLHGPEGFYQRGNDWGQLFEQAQMLAKDMPEPTPQQLALGRRRAAVEVARDAIGEYNAWLNGENYGVIVQTHELESGKLLNSDECWNYIGSDYAKETLESQVASTLKSLQAHQEPA